MLGSYALILDPFILQVCHVKIQALITDHLISKIWEFFYSDHLEYNRPQDEGDASEPITFRQYLANMTSKTRKYA